MNEIVTYFSSHKSELVKPVKLGLVLQSFREGKYATKIAQVRNILNKEGEKAYKLAKKTLPAIAFCGEFSGGHAKEDLVKYNGLLVFDIDHLAGESMAQAYYNLAQNRFIYAFWVSPSGNGYKGLIKIDYLNVHDLLTLDTCYKKAFADVTDYFWSEFEIKLDTNCSDYSRICYVCWDEHLYMNKAAESFVVDCIGVTEDGKKRSAKDEKSFGVCPASAELKEGVFKPVNVAGKNSQHDRDTLSSIIKYLSKRNLSITRTYDEWLRVGFAIANTFNYDLGLKYYLALSKLDKGLYDEAACIEKLQECYMNGRGEVTLGTIVEMARSKGYDK